MLLFWVIHLEYHFGHPQQLDGILFNWSQRRRSSSRLKSHTRTTLDPPLRHDFGCGQFNVSTPIYHEPRRRSKLVLVDDDDGDLNKYATKSVRNDLNEFWWTALQSNLWRYNSPVAIVIFSPALSLADLWSSSKRWKQWTHNLNQAPVLSSLVLCLLSLAKPSTAHISPVQTDHVARREPINFLCPTSGPNARWECPKMLFYAEIGHVLRGHHHHFFVIISSICFKRRRHRYMNGQTDWPKHSFWCCAKVCAKHPLINVLGHVFKNDVSAEPCHPIWYNLFSGTKTFTMWSEMRNGRPLSIHFKTPLTG